MTNLSADLKLLTIDLNLQGLLENLIKLLRQEDRKRELGETFARISVLLNESSEEIRGRRLPRKQSAEIAALLHTFKVVKNQRLLDKKPEIRDAVDDFEDLGFRMRQADYFIDRKCHSSITDRSMYYPRPEEQKITKKDVDDIVEAIDRFSSRLSGIAFTLGYRAQNH